MEKGVLGQRNEEKVEEIAEKGNAIIGLLRDITQTISGKKAKRLEKKWDFSSEDAVTSLTSASLDKKYAIVFATKSGKVYVLDENAKIKWIYNLQEKLTETEKFFMEESSVKNIYTTPAVADINGDRKNEIIFGTDTGRVYALNSSGRLLWSFKTRNAIRSSPLAADINNDKKTEAVFGCNDKNLYALNSKGKLLWKFKANAGIEAKPSLLKNKKQMQIIFGSNDGTVYSLNEKGKLIWKFKTNDKITAAASIGKIYGDGKDYIVVGSFDNYIYALNSKGKLKWKYKTEGNIFSEASLADINNDKKLEIVFGSCDDNVYALSCSGEKIWNYETDFWVASAPLVVDIDNDGKLEVIAGSYDRSLYILDAEGAFLMDYMPGISSATQQSGYYDAPITNEVGGYYGKKLWEYKTGGMVLNAICIANKEKSIIIGTDNGKISSFTIR